jgi:hypothetical protein
LEVLELAVDDVAANLTDVDELVDVFFQWVLSRLLVGAGARASACSS